MMLNFFFPKEGYNFEKTGISMTGPKAKPMDSEDESCWFRGVVGCIISDADAFAKLSMWKSASGSKCCGLCQNVFGRIDPKDIPDASGFVHYTCGDPEKFVTYKWQRLVELYNHLGEQKRLSPNKTAFEKLQRAAGYTYSEYGLLASDMAPIVRFPETLYYDWMHTIVSNGGVAQWELNQLLIRIKGLSPGNILIEKLDSFQTPYTSPSENSNRRN